VTPRRRASRPANESGTFDGNVSRDREVSQSLKKLTRNQLQGDGGVHRFAARVGDSGLAFHPTGALDAGIDGFIELRDPETGEVKAQYIAAQLKTTLAVVSTISRLWPDWCSLVINTLTCCRSRRDQD